MKTTMVVCNVYSLFKEGTRYTKQGKKLMRSKVVLPREYAEEKNNSWETNGLVHEILEEETEKYYKDSFILVKKREEAKKIAGQLRDTLTDVLKKGNEKEQQIVNIDVIEDDVVKEEVLEKKTPVKRVVKRNVKRRKTKK